MEINVTNNCNGGSGGVSNVCLNTQDEISVLPKTLDLPPSYDEAAFSERKQDSTLTIATSLEASNPNLATGINEPPPVYEALSMVSLTRFCALQVAPLLRRRVGVEIPKSVIKSQRFKFCGPPLAATADRLTSEQLTQQRA